MALLNLLCCTAQENHPRSDTTSSGLRAPTPHINKGNGRKLSRGQSDGEILSIEGPLQDNASCGKLSENWSDHQHINRLKGRNGKIISLDMASLWLHTISFHGKSPKESRDTGAMCPHNKGNIQHAYSPYHARWLFTNSPFLYYFPLINFLEACYCVLSHVVSLGLLPLWCIFLYRCFYLYIDNPVTGFLGSFWIPIFKVSVWQIIKHFHTSLSSYNSIHLIFSNHWHLKSIVEKLLTL